MNTWGWVKELITPVTNLVDQLVPDSDQRATLKMELFNAQASLTEKMIDAELKIAATRSEIIKAEVASKNKLASSWRPLLMLVCVLAVVNNLIVAPYVMLIFGVEVDLEIPEWISQLLLIGVGGYLPLRSVEKLGPKLLEAWSQRKEGKQ